MANKDQMFARLVNFEKFCHLVNFHRVVSTVKIHRKCILSCLIEPMILNTKMTSDFDGNLFDLGGSENPKVRYLKKLDIQIFYSFA